MLMRSVKLSLFNLQTNAGQMTLSIHQQRLQNDRLLLEVNASNANARKHLFNLCDRLRSDLSTKPKIHISQNFEYSSINISTTVLFCVDGETTLCIFLASIKFIMKILQAKWIYDFCPFSIFFSGFLKIHQIIWSI